jgi:O-acetyl-ADP-ribose deacetylase (regulator of RNase III)
VFRAEESALLLVLSDTNPEVVMAFMQAFGAYEGVTFGSGNILQARIDSIVSPANSFGFMDGGIDLAYRNFFGLGIQRVVQSVIQDRYGGELPVGSAFLAPTNHQRITHMIVAPTMKTPRNIVGTDNVYQATKAALLCAQEANPPLERLGVPGMGTGVGGMDSFDAAGQMLKAFLEVLKPGFRTD